MFKHPRAFRLIRFVTICQNDKDRCLRTDVWVVRHVKLKKVILGEIVLGVYGRTIKTALAVLLPRAQFVFMCNRFLDK